MSEESNVFSLVGENGPEPGQYGYEEPEHELPALPTVGARFITPDPMIVLDVDSAILSLDAAKELAVSLADALNEAAAATSV